MTPTSSPKRTDSLYLLLGAFGDICIMLPHFYDTWQFTHVKPQVVVSKYYASIFDGVSYVEPIIYDGTYHRGDRQLLKQAYDFAMEASGGRPLICLNPIRTQGLAMPHRTDSFVKEMWAVVGREPAWDERPLVFDKRSAEDEAKLVQSVRLTDRPLILTALTGRTSPFRQRDDLLDALNKRFPKHDVMDISTLAASRVYHLLGLFDAADLLVASDTMHLHLSRASQVPVIALTRDDPTLWNGTPPQSRFKFYCKYGEYPAKKEALLDAAQNIVCQKSQP